MSAEFSGMLNDHLHYPLLKKELEKKNYVWKMAKHDEEATGDIIVPFEEAGATSVKAGAGPTAENDIASFTYVRASISEANKKKMWMSLQFQHEDIMDHNGRVKQKSFLGTFLPQQVRSGTDYFSESLNHMILNSAHIVTATATGTNAGVVTVDRIERLHIGQKITFDLGSDVTGYVTAIDINAGTATLEDARSGGSAVDCQTVVSGTKGYQDGLVTSANRITSLKDILLTNANGGLASYLGQTKANYTFLQSYNADGSAVTANNILEKIFDMIVMYRRLGRRGASEVWCSFYHAGSIMKILEQDKGPYKAVAGSTKSSEYGFTEITIFGPKTGEIKFVFLPEMDDDVINLMDPKSITIHSVGGLQKITSPDGLNYKTVRSSTAGYSYICDMIFKGEIVVKPCNNAIMHSINY